MLYSHFHILTSFASTIPFYTYYLPCRLWLLGSEFCFFGFDDLDNPWDTGQVFCHVPLWESADVYLMIRLGLWNGEKVKKLKQNIIFIISYHIKGTDSRQGIVSDVTDHVAGVAFAQCKAPCNSHTPPCYAVCFPTGKETTLLSWRLPSGVKLHLFRTNYLRKSFRILPHGRSLFPLLFIYKSWLRLFALHYGYNLIPFFLLLKLFQLWSLRALSVDFFDKFFLTNFFWQIPSLWALAFSFTF